MTPRTRRVYFAAAALLGLGSLAGGYYAVDLVHPQAQDDAQASAVDAAQVPAASGPVVDALTAAGLVRGEWSTRPRCGRSSTSCRRTRT